MIDDAEPEARGFGYLNETFRTNPGDADPDKLPHKPASFVVTLRHTCSVEAVAYAAMSPTRPERPKDLLVFTSPHAIGERWELQKELRDIQGGIYEELAFAKPVRAKRVKFVIPRVWNTQVDAQRKTAHGYLAELYVYGTALPGNLRVSVDRDAVSTASVFDAQGKLVRSLWQLRPMLAGEHVEEWDGLTDTFADAPAGTYELRLVTNPGRYENVAAIGNTGYPPDADGHVPMSTSSVVVDRDGAVFTANNWDEAGHDWKKWDRDGRNLMHANFQVRNGNPNGLPYLAAVDEQSLYVAYISHGEADAGGQWLQRFDRQTGKPVRFSKGLERNGLIQVYPPNREQKWNRPLVGLAVAEGILLVADSDGNRVLKYDKVTGEPRGQFAVEKPGRLAVDARRPGVDRARPAAHRRVRSRRAPAGGAVDRPGQDRGPELRARWPPVRGGRSGTADRALPHRRPDGDARVGPRPPGQPGRRRAGPLLRTGRRGRRSGRQRGDRRAVPGGRHAGHEVVGGVQDRPTGRTWGSSSPATPTTRRTNRTRWSATTSSAIGWTRAPARGGSRATCSPAAIPK